MDFWQQVVLFLDFPCGESIVLPTEHKQQWKKRRRPEATKERRENIERKSSGLCGAVSFAYTKVNYLGQKPVAGIEPASFSNKKKSPVGELNLKRTSGRFFYSFLTFINNRSIKLCYHITCITV